MPDPSTTQQTVPAPFAAFIGIDWADQQHAICLCPVGSDRVEHATLSHTPEALAEWKAKLLERFGGRPVAVALEQRRGPLLHALMGSEWLVLYPIHSTTLENYRGAFLPSGAKDDPGDAFWAADLLRHHHAQLRPWRPDDAATRTLARLVEDRRQAVNLRTRLVQKLTAALKEYYPQALEWAGPKLSAPLAWDFLERWPTLAAVQAAVPGTVREFYQQHPCRDGEAIEARCQQIAQGQALTADAAVVEAGAMKTAMLVGQLRAMGPAIERYEERIAELFGSHVDAKLFASVPGAGPALAPRLLVAFGSDRERFQKAAELQCFSGAAPVTVCSGQSRWVHWRWACPKFLRQSFVEFADQSLSRSEWAGAFYEQQREAGKSHQAVLRAVAFKWIRILFRCWKDRQPYNEAVYLAALRRRGSPLMARIDARRIASAAA
jgi:transposase